jgi:hypothetical protein
MKLKRELKKTFFEKTSQKIQKKATICRFLIEEKNHFN